MSASSNRKKRANFRQQEIFFCYPVSLRMQHEKIAKTASSPIYSYRLGYTTGNLETVLVLKFLRPWFHLALKRRGILVMSRQPLC